MGSLALIIPLVILGAIVWAVVGVFRQRAGERVTLATAASLYAHLMTVVGLILVLAAGSTAVKIAVSLLNPGYSYYVGYGGDPTGVKGGAPVGPPANYFQVQREQDLIFVGVLGVAGLLVLGGHWLLARVTRGLPGGGPSWITRGVVIALTVFTGVPGILSAIFAAYSILVFALIPQPGGMPFGDALGAAAVFLPAWLAATWVLLRQLRPRVGLSAAAPAPA